MTEETTPGESKRAEDALVAAAAVEAGIEPDMDAFIRDANRRLSVVDAASFGFVRMLGTLLNIFVALGRGFAESGVADRRIS